MRWAAGLLLTAALLAQTPSTSAGDAAPAASGPNQAVDKAAIEAYVRHLFLWPVAQVQVTVANPVASVLPGFYDVVISASDGRSQQVETIMVTADGRKMVRGTVYDLGVGPFQADFTKISRAGAAVLGSASAPVEVVVFSDFQCSYCKRLADTLRTQVLPAMGGDLRLVFKDLPLDQIHPWARRAAVAGRCIYKQKPDAFWAYHDWIFGQQEKTTAENFDAALAAFAKGQSLGGEALTACMASPEAAAEVERSVDEARTLGINSTPTLYINGRKMAGALPWEQLKIILEYERDYAKTQGRKSMAEGR